MLRQGRPRCSRGRSSRRILPSPLACALAATLSLGGALAERTPDPERREIWPKAPLVGLREVERRRQTNPLSDRAYLVAGQHRAALRRFGSRAGTTFSLALKRVPDDAYATLELGAIASEMGHARRPSNCSSGRLLNPRDPLTRQALKTVQRAERQRGSAEPRNPAQS